MALESDKEPTEPASFVPKKSAESTIMIPVMERNNLQWRLSNMGASLRRSPVGMIGMTIILIVIFLAIFGPYVSPHDPIQRNLRTRFVEPGYEDENGKFILGTDQLGRDIFSRVISGARLTVKERLSKLESLRHQGIVTDDEHEEQRRRILNDL